MVYAVVRAGGRQEKVEVGTIVTMDRIKADKDGNVQLTPVLLVDGDKITSDAKSLAKVTVTAEVLNDLRGPKIVMTGARPARSRDNPSFPSCSATWST